MRRKLARGFNGGDMAPAKMSGLHSAASIPYSPLDQDGVARILEAALHLLADSGACFEPGTEADALLRRAGCEVSGDGIVRIPVEVTRRALATTARSVALWNRSGAAAIDIDCEHSWFIPGMTCIKVFDPVTGAPRESMRADLATIARVADALSHIDGVCVACKNVARSDAAGEVDEFLCLVENTEKPLFYLCENASSLATAIEMARIVRGGAEALRAKPYFLQIVTPLPLSYAASHIEQIILAARTGVPVSTGTVAIGGASSPITLAGCLVHCLATDFAGMVLAQAVRPGAFCIGSSDVNFMEPATGAIGSFAQASLGDLAAAQIRRHLCLPSLTSIAGSSVARRFNQDAVWEISSSLMQAFFSRPATCHYLGSLDQGLTYSLQALLLSNDLAMLLRKMWQGIAVDDEQLALDIARDVGPRGNFLGQIHTARHCRSQVWNSRYFGPNIPLSNSDRADEELFERIDADLKTIMNTHQVPPLPAAVAARLERFGLDRLSSEQPVLESLIGEFVDGPPSRTMTRR
ncbi:trimethylamine methyltransferase family protein [Dongia sp.]|uniref:trimethylamine methyltransferase family protein n=1 Tax=Dongia sp. TaxID=1977262 RepID=UPI0035B46031